MQSTFEFYNYLDEAMIKEFTVFCSQQPMFHNTCLRFSSPMGTLTKNVEKTAVLITDLKSKGIAVNTHADLLVSGYVRLFLLGRHRTIIPTTTAKIHLPVLTAGHQVIKGITDVQLKMLRNEIAVFISSRTTMSVDDVFRLNEQRLKAHEILQYGIAHEVVENFETLVSR